MIFFYFVDEVNTSGATMGAQLPYPVQPQGMPLPYTLPRTGPYPTYMCAPPMPTTYNPYATLHYPQQQQGMTPSFYLIDTLCDDFKLKFCILFNINGYFLIIFFVLKVKC